MVRSKNDLVFDIIVFLFIAVIALFCLIPILYVVSASLTPIEEMLRNRGFVLIPRKASLAAYKDMLQDPSLMSSMWVSIRVTVIGTALNLLFTMTLAYPLSREHLHGRSLLIKLIVFTMIFSAGIVPTYLVVKGTGVVNTIWSLIIPSLVTVYNFVIMKSFFEGLPADLFESARIDGAGEFRILFSIVMPLSLPIITTVGLYYAVSHWNVYTAAIYYITDYSKMPLQVILRRIIESASMQDLNADAVIPTETLQMAAVCIATAPIIIIYPFIQKYFVKGTLAGAVKG